TDGMRPATGDKVELILNRTWRPQLAITGAGGLPAISSAGNVLRPSTSLKLSLRLPPTVDAEQARGFVARLLEADPPYGARVAFKHGESGNGWNAPKLSDWLNAAVAQASRDAFSTPAAYMGEGGSIPFMGMLGEKFPEAQFLITGVLGPHSNAHGPNEFLHIPTGKKVSQVVASVVAAHASASGRGLT
ncbi:MAG: peptidase M20, partial [Rhodanobacteraceae bacterium]